MQPAHSQDTPQQHTWRAPYLRRALWASAIIICLIHILGIAAWIAFTPTFQATLDAGPPDLTVYHNAGLALLARRSTGLLPGQMRWPTIIRRRSRCCTPG